MAEPFHRCIASSTEGSSSNLSSHAEAVADCLGNGHLPFAGQGGIRGHRSLTFLTLFMIVRNALRPYCARAMSLLEGAWDIAIPKNYRVRSRANLRDSTWPAKGHLRMTWINRFDMRQHWMF
jgi:hypothetical protein